MTQGKTDGLSSNVSDLFVLPVEVPAAIESWAPCYHRLFLRRHRPQSTEQIGADAGINGRSLYAVNVPVDSTVSHFRAMFSKLSGARVEDAIFEDEPVPLELRAKIAEASEKPPTYGHSKKRKRGTEEAATASATDYLEESNIPKVWDRVVHRCGSAAVIVFVDAAGLEATLRALKKRPQTLEGGSASKESRIIWGDGVGDGNQIPPLGSARYENHRRLIYPDIYELIENIDMAVATYDADQAAIEELQSRAASEPDEDGFVTVVRGPKARVQTSVSEANNDAAKKATSAGKGVYSDFYRFQLRDVKKQQMRNLLTRFEDGRRKIKDLNERRNVRRA